MRAMNHAAPSADDARRLSVAPMMDLTDRHARYMLRLISRHALLYTEMVTTGAVLHGDREHLLGFDPSEHPVALQLGGSDPAALAESARVGEEWGYDEINLNCGCPSDRVQSGRFGACLMAEPELVAHCIAAMQEQVSIPVTIKTRIGIDRRDEWDDLRTLVEQVAATGCDTFIVHARKAWLDGLSPKQNREVPPLRYDIVYRLKELFPDLHITVNGGITSIEETGRHLQHVDGVMIGRGAYYNPSMLLGADREIFGSDAQPASRAQVVEQYTEYMKHQIARGARLHNMARHLLGLYQGQPGARRFRRFISENLPRRKQDIGVIEEAAAMLAEFSCSMTRARYPD